MRNLGESGSIAAGPDRPGMLEHLSGPEAANGGRARLGRSRTAGHEAATGAVLAGAGRNPGHGRVAPLPDGRRTLLWRRTRRFM